MDNPQERQTLFDIGWLIGIIDGEGSFMIGSIKRSEIKTDYFPLIEVGNTNHKIILKAQSIISSHGLACYVQFKPRKHIKNGGYWSLQIRGLKRMKNFLDKFYDCFECRREQANVLKRYVELRLSKPATTPHGDGERWLMEQLRTLNQRGFVSSETTRQTPIGEDIVRTSSRDEEPDRNVLARSVSE